MGVYRVEALTSSIPVRFDWWRKLLNALLFFFTSSIIRKPVEIIGPVAISFIIFHPKTCHNVGLIGWFTGVFAAYCLVSFILELIIGSRPQMWKTSLAFLEQHNIVNENTARKMLSTLDYIEQDMRHKHIADLDDVSYQQISQTVCQAAYNALKDAIGSREFHITLYHRFREPDNDYIKVIAYANKNGIIPNDMNDQYPLNVTVEPLDYFFRQAFRNNNNEVYTFLNPKEVSQSYIKNPKNTRRESKIKQCLAVPVFCEQQGVVSLLQVDTSENKLLGANQNEMEELANQLRSFTNLLMFSYYNYMSLLSMYIKLSNGRR